MIVPITLAAANDYVRRHHRHSKPVRGSKFAIGVADPAGAILGVAIAGRPVARVLDDGFTIEVLRVCTLGARNACSLLYGACCRAAAAMGYRMAVTYTLDSELGVSTKAAGFRAVAGVPDRQWDCASRPREQRELVGGKIRWERRL